MYSGNAVLLELETAFENGGNIAAALTDEAIQSENEKCITAGWLPDEGNTSSLCFLPNRKLKNLSFFCNFQDSSSEERKQYISEFKLPSLSTEKCNSTDHFAGSLPNDAICEENTENIPNGNDSNCYVSCLTSTIHLLHLQKSFKY